jgi:hypothetical protein
LPDNETDRLKELYQRFLNAVDEQAMTVDWTQMPNRYTSNFTYQKQYDAFEEHQRRNFFRVVGLKLRCSQNLVALINFAA